MNSDEYTINGRIIARQTNQGIPTYVTRDRLIPQISAAIF